MPDTRYYVDFPLDPDEARKAKLRSLGTATPVPAQSAGDFMNDVRTLIDYMDSEYVGPEIAKVLRRLRFAAGRAA